jgi:hypothetical protein
MCNQSKLAQFSIANKIKLRKMRRFGRCVAQLGSALRWGRRGRRFESYHTDQLSYYLPPILLSVYPNFNLVAAIIAGGEGVLGSNPITPTN